MQPLCNIRTLPSSEAMDTKEPTVEMAAKVIWPIFSMALCPRTDKRPQALIWRHDTHLPFPRRWSGVTNLYCFRPASARLARPSWFSQTEFLLSAQYAFTILSPASFYHMWSWIGSSTSGSWSESAWSVWACLFWVVVAYSILHCTPPVLVLLVWSMPLMIESPHTFQLFNKKVELYSWYSISAPCVHSYNHLIIRSIFATQRANRFYYLREA